MAVSFIAKFKTTFQMVALFLLLWYVPQDTKATALWLGALFLSVAAVLTLWTMILYLRIAWPDLTSQREQ